MVFTGEGYITFTGTTPVYHYYLKDHLGNNRVIINQSGATEQVTILNETTVVRAGEAEPNVELVPITK